ncbi:MAG: MFS transporter [Chloroflexi bacterium]|nr:MFS transporter [Chloroflexota bacterium]
MSKTVSLRAEEPKEVARAPFFYGWIILGACTLLLVIHAGIVFSFAVFFKPLANDFGWNRAATAGIQSLFLICLNGNAIFAGLLVDRLGPRKVAMTANLLAVAGLLLASRISSLWQLYLTYGVMTGLGMSANFSLSNATVSRWFLKSRGLALGIVSAGTGLGGLIITPTAERLIANFGWSNTYIITALALLAVVAVSALLLKRDPAQMGLRPYGADASPQAAATATKEPPGIGFGAAMRTRPLQKLVLIYFSLSFCLQIVMVHLVNYATDIGVSATTAAILLSIVGLGSMSGRLIMGPISDRIGNKQALVICCAGLALSLLWLVFSRELWMLFAFAIFFGLTYGGEIPQIVALLGRYYGLRSLSMLIGTVMAGNSLGGALGAWSAGRIYDVTETYSLAFVLATVFSLVALGFILTLKRPAAGS